MVFDKEFKEAILSLPEKEKDKLLLRLLKKDKTLVDKLYFELVSDLSVDETREKLANTIIERLDQLKYHDFHPGWFMMEQRYLSGDITYHVKTTKDKIGEVSLNLLLLNKFLENFNSEIVQARTKKYYKLVIYMIAKTYRILLNINALHDDYLLDFENDLKTLGNHFAKNRHIMKLCINSGLDVNWLIQPKIPKDIVEFHKDLRKQGFLK